MEKHTEDKLKSALKEKFFNYRVEPEDLHWFDIEGHIPAAGTAGRGSWSRWLGMAASLLLVFSLLSLLLFTADDRGKTVDMLPDVGDEGAGAPAGTATSPVVTPQGGGVDTSERAAAVDPGPEMQAGNGVSPSGDLDAVRPPAPDGLPVRQVRPVLPPSGKPVGNPVPFSSEKGPRIGPAVSAHPGVVTSWGLKGAQATRGFGIAADRAYVSFEPSLQYRQLEPNRNDIVFLSGLEAPPPIAADRAGFQLFAGMERDLSRGLSLHSGLSYSYQRSNLGYRSTNLVSRHVEEVERTEHRHRLGVALGLRVLLRKEGPVSHALVLESEFRKSLRGPADNQVTLGVGYEIRHTYPAGRFAVSIQPVARVALSQDKRELFHSRPYWLGVRIVLFREFSWSAEY